jgi:dephospho-CoA kinase
MTHQSNLKILAFVGMTGSGKSTAIEYFTEKGFPRVYFGGVIYQAMAEAGIEKGEENEKTFRVEIREKEGNDFIVKRIIKQIEDLNEAGQHRIIADGVYSWDEYKALQHAFPGNVTFVAVTAPKHKRYHWLESRGDRPQPAAVSAARDEREIEDLQKGGPIAAADYFIHNDGSVEEMQRQLAAIAEDLDF